MKTNGLVLAAGLSKRMGDFKPLLNMGRQTLLEACVQSMLEGGVSQVTVVLGHRAAEVASQLQRTFTQAQVSIAINHAYATTDMLASIRVGLAALPACDAFFLLPGDMPAVAPETFHSLSIAMAQGGALVAFPTLAGQRKHPPLIAAEAIPALLDYKGVSGLRGAWAGLAGRMVDVPVTDQGCALDADTADDFARLSDYVAARQDKG